MKIRKSVLKQDLRDMPIDHGDMFLMSQAEDLIDSCEVADLMPWEADETERRLAALVELGLLEWVNEKGEPIDRVKRDTMPNFYVAVTLRPKAPEPAADLFRKTETSVVALRALDGLLFLDQAVIHNDRSVFSRATLVKEEARQPEGPVFATARPPVPNPDDPIHFSLPPLSGVMSSTAAMMPRPPARPAARAESDEAPIHFSLPPFLGEPLRSLPPLLGASYPATLGDSEPDEPHFISLPPFPEDDAPERGFLSKETCVQEKQAEPIRFKQPVFVGAKAPEPTFMTRATRVLEEPASTLSRATVPGEVPAERNVMARGTLVYEKAPARSVYERTTVVDEDVEERAQFEKASTAKQVNGKRR